MIAKHLNQAQGTVLPPRLQAPEAGPGHSTATCQERMFNREVELGTDSSFNKLWLKQHAFASFTESYNLMSLRAGPAPGLTRASCEWGSLCLMRHQHHGKPAPLNRVGAQQILEWPGRDGADKTNERRLQHGHNSVRQVQKALLHEMWGCEFKAKERTQWLHPVRQSWVLEAWRHHPNPPGPGCSSGTIWWQSSSLNQNWGGPFEILWLTWLFQDSGSDFRNLLMNWSKFHA